MKIIKNGIVFSEDIKRILEGVNAFDYVYEKVPSNQKIEELRKSFRTDVDKMFEAITIISEEEMLEVGTLIDGVYPHHHLRQNLYRTR